MTYIKKITSHHNPNIKALRALDSRKKRDKENLFLAEGLQIIGMAKECGWIPTQFVYEEGEMSSDFASSLIDWALSNDIQVMEVPYDVMGKLSTRDNPQPAIASFQQKLSNLNDVKSGVWVVLEDIRDPGNLGTIIRTVDAVGAKGVILIGHTCDPFAMETVRASMGSIFAVPIIKTTLQEFRMHVTKSWQGEIIATHLEGQENFRRKYQNDCLLLMGSEGPGLSNDMAHLASTKVKIPMHGHAESLNLAVATALILYEAKGL